MTSEKNIVGLCKATVGLPQETNFHLFCTFYKAEDSAQKKKQGKPT